MTAATGFRAAKPAGMDDAELLPISQTGLLCKFLIRYHDYEGLALNMEDQERPLADLGPTGQIMFLRNHGILACGRTIPEAFVMLYYLEEACRIQVAAQAGGAIVTPQHHVQDLTQAQAMRGFGADYAT